MDQAKSYRTLDGSEKITRQEDDKSSLHTCNSDTTAAERISNESVSDEPSKSDKSLGVEKNDIDSQSVSQEAPVALKVPRAQRRGLFGRFTLLAEVNDPRRYPRRVKWFITFVIACAALVAPLGSTIIFRMVYQYPLNNV